VAARKAELEKLTASREEDPGRANAALTALETDLEGADAEPTSPQRDVLAAYQKGMDRFEAGWKAYSSGPFAHLARDLERLGIKAADR
jgi:hypothetical protein